MIIIGADPGLSGAVAVICNGELIALEDMPTVTRVRNKKNKKDVDYRKLGAFMRRFEPDMAVVEQVGAMPGQGTSSMFAFGKATGSVLGAYGALGFEIEEILPGTWKKHFGLIGEEKDMARIFALDKFQSWEKELSRKKDCGRADAALIALYAWELRN